MLVIATQHPVPVMSGAAKDGEEFIRPAPAEPVDVEENAYYLRRITAGELERVSTKSGAKQAAKKDEAKA
ncbi:hypothetical protein [Pseudomonas sp. Irchel 3E13]|uniref:hypothetical protein n=1 Tax=Pseudomonas sp. Irchel 3E13 TaxID=2008975 RepID=UPI000BA2C6A2|nr:hypothetical protein [Pseudomonas sp. Irchel 3E13]